MKKTQKRRGGGFAVLAGFAVMLAVSAGPSTAQEVLNFNALSNRQIVDDEFSGQGVFIKVDNFGRTTDLGVIFDTRLRNTFDDDLEGPNGSDSETWADGNVAPDEVLGNVLIIEENGFEDGGNPGFIDRDPDDERRKPAGEITFEFSKALVAFEIVILDIESDIAATTTLTFFAGNSELTSVSIDTIRNDNSNPFHDPTVEFANNSANRLSGFTAAELGGTPDKVEVKLGGSAAVTGVKFTEVPEPVTMGLLGIGGIAVALRRRRRRAA